MYFAYTTCPACAKTYGKNQHQTVEPRPRNLEIWEGFLIGEVLRALRATREQAYFWATHAVRRRHPKPQTSC
jgi:hypothetical protein